jgi:hypothetical protein
MADEITLSPGDVRTLARSAGLDLADGRAELLAPQLSVWLTAAGELNALMSRPEHQTVVPATVFTHPSTGRDEQ